MSYQAMVIDPRDNVAVALEDIPARQEIEVPASEPGPPLIAAERIPFGHKVALRNIRRGEGVIKYGERIGVATVDIPAGHHVHVHNLSGLMAARRGPAG